MNRVSGLIAVAVYGMATAKHDCGRWAWMSALMAGINHASALSAVNCSVNSTRVTLLGPAKAHDGNPNSQKVDSSD